MRFDYIFLDSGGTLYANATDSGPTPAETAEGRPRRVQAALAELGAQCSVSDVAGAIARREEPCRRRWGAGYNFHRLMHDALQELRLPFGSEVAACLADAYAGPRYASWLFPGTVEGVRTLYEAGVRLGIIANTPWPGFTMDRAFAGVGLLTFFQVRLYSGDIGIEKPDVRIFRIAEDLSGCSGNRVLYVGNDPIADMEGARRAGWCTAYRKNEALCPAGLTDFEFDRVSELVAFCLD